MQRSSTPHEESGSRARQLVIVADVAEAAAAEKRRQPAQLRSLGVMNAVR